MSHNKSCWYPCISISQHLSYHWIHGHALLKEEHAQVASWWCGFMLEIFDMCMHCMLGQDCLDISMQSWTEQPHQSTCMMVSITVACYKLSSHKTGMPAILPHCFENSSKPNRSTTHVINIDGNLCFIFRTWIGHSICCHTQPYIASSHHGVIHRSCFVLQSQLCLNPWHFLRCPGCHEANKILAVDLFLSAAKTERRLHVRCNRYL